MVGIKIKFRCDSSWLSASGYPIELQGEIYDDLLVDVYNNPRWYLDNFRMMREFRVAWGNYKNPGITKRYNNENKEEKEEKAKAL